MLWPGGPKRASHHILAYPFIHWDLPPSYHSPMRFLSSGAVVLNLGHVLGSPIGLLKIHLLGLWPETMKVWEEVHACVFQQVYANDFNTYPS